MEQIFQAHGAVRVELSRFAFVIHCDNTRAAGVAMHVIIVAFDTAQSALVAMVIISLGSVVEEVARRGGGASQLVRRHTWLHGLVRVHVLVLRGRSSRESRPRLSGRTSR
jgi:hypothetical protein